MDIAIVTDSTSDIPPQLAKQYHIQIIPNIMVLDGQSLEDGKGITRQEFYARLPLLKELPTTAAPSSGSYQAAYEGLFAQGINQIISIHAPSLLSGIFNTARLAAQAFGERVHVIDSGYVTLGLGYQALAAAEAVLNGATVDAVLEKIQDVRRRIRLIAMLDTLEYVRRSGRVSWAKASLGSLLQIKMFIELKDGIVLRFGVARTRRKGIARLASLIEGLGVLERLAVLHTNAESEAHHLLNKLSSLPQNPMVVNVTTIIGAHVGPNGLGFVAVVK